MTRLTIMRLFSGVLVVLCFMVVGNTVADFMVRSQLVDETRQERELLVRNNRCNQLLRNEIADLGRTSHVKSAISNELHWAEEGAIIYRFDDNVADESLRGTPCYGR